MENRFVIFYDWDGTLIDSLPAHIKFLRDMSKRFKLGLDLPDPKDREASKRLVQAPMTEFLRNAGIPEECIPKINKIYINEFNKNSKYNSELFPGVLEMIQRFSEKEVVQGVLTLNYQQNINKVLKKQGIYPLLFPIGDKTELDRFHAGRKSRFLKHHKIMNSLSENEMIYIGDMKGDYESAKEAGISFIGISYGWGFSPEEKTDFPIVDNVRDLEKKIMQFA